MKVFASMDLSNVRFDGPIGSDVGIGVDKTGANVRFRLSPDDATSLASVLLSDLPFSGNVTIGTAEILV